MVGCMHDLALARAGQHAAEARLATYATAPNVAVRQGDGWFAVRTGADSNDMNGVVSAAHADISPQLVKDLIAWFAAGLTPACWLTGEADPQLTETLLGCGAQPERSGRWSGRAVPPEMPQVDAGTGLVQVASETDLDRWLDLAAGCGWIQSEKDRQARRQLYRSLGLEHGAALSHWLALEQDRPVGFASSYLDQDVVDLCNLGVAEAHRRRGIGRAMVEVRLASAARLGATTVVSAPSHDGWQLQKALGFRNVPVVADTCFYLSV